ncbi:hypothetical protein RND81_09G057400 [Saponaria officinalis]|uniref:Wax synthase domain-containing protein n=1 Tax=Saponaria officinalis TaxID=3572 RepID=A0AAW1IJ88_SAPOF
MESEAKTLIKVWSIIFASLCYSYFIVSKLPLGKSRLISILPLIYLYTILPLYLSSKLLIGITSFFITWLTTFKLILLSYNLGPLTTPSILDHTENQRKGSDVRSLENDRRQTIKSFPKFVFIAAFPVKGKDPFAPTKKPTKVVPLNLWSEALISSILIAVCDRYKQKIHPGGILVIYGFLLYFLVDVIIGIANKLVGSIVDVELIQPSNEPYLATSIQNFWGQRWNLMVTDTLRNTVYKPTRVFLSNYIGNGWAISIAMTTSFFVSGLMHELIFYYLTRVSPSWEITWFFVLHGLCVVLEVALKKALGRTVRFHWAITGPLTIGFVLGTAYLWFFPPLVRNEVDVRTIEEFKSLYEFIKGKFVWNSTALL